MSIPQEKLEQIILLGLKEQEQGIVLTALAESGFSNNSELLDDINGMLDRLLGRGNLLGEHTQRCVVPFVQNVHLASILYKELDSLQVL
mmetsp:Transcript_7469/g.6760  ORF Transcript_7469/g.6760 Transcript_7469/m.6760 type:complete len:89 (+) Transcript_7469:333-599(+)